ncbi:hypothetical protein SprV_0100488500 [Sparganum proliferum]
MRSLLGDMQVDEKLVKEMFLERLPADVQTILASGSQDLTLSHFAEMADRMIEVQRFQPPSVAQISTPSSTVNEQLLQQMSAVANEIASLKLQFARITWKPASRRIDATVFSGSPSSGRTLYVCDKVTRRRFLVDTGAQISVVPPTPVDRRCPSPGLHLQAANCSPISTFGSRSLTLNIGLRRSFSWIFVIADVPHAILGSDFLAEFDLLVDCRRSCLLDRTTGLSVRGLTPFNDSCNLSVLDTGIACPYRDLLLQHPNITKPQFRSGEIQHDVVHHIRTSGPQVFARPRRLAPSRLQAAKAEFEHMLQLGIIRPSESPWASPLHMVPKATSDDWRPCGDYRALNNVTIPDRYPVPHLQDFAGVLFGKSVFSKIDLVRAFLSLLRMFPKLPSPHHSACSNLFACHLVSAMLPKHFRVFDRLDQFGVVINPSKCVLGVPSLDFLGHHVDAQSLRPLSSKVEAIRDFPLPTSKRQLQRFLGMVDFYRRFLPNCADLMLPLTNMLSVPKGPLELTGEALTAFERIHNSLADATLLTHPAPEAQLSLMVDASTVAVGAVLQQHLAGSTQPLAFFSKKLLPAETRYSTFGRELLAIYLAVKHFRHFLEGQEFTIFTDHIRHIDGSRNEVADALSRPSIAHLQLSPGIDLAEMAAEQRRVGSPCDEDVSGLQLQELPLKTGNGTILCDVSTPSHRPFVPPSLRRPLPLSNGCSYLLTCVDRFTRWPEAIPLPDVAAPTVVKAFLSRWVAIFGAPSTITTDRGAQFESNLFQSLLSFLGCTRIRTTAYHPAANGMVERFHRQLKASLRAADDPENWTDHLPLVLLGIRSSLKSNPDCSAAELVFGATVRLPGQMISPTPRVAVEDPTNLLHRLRQFLRTLSPVPPRSSASPSYLEKDLATCSHVYLRCDRVRRPLEPPYYGPFRVISRGTKNFRIQCGTREEVVSVDRLKAADPDTPPDEPCGPLPPAPPPRPSIHPSRILPLPPCPQPTTATTPSLTNNTTPPKPSAPLRATFGLAGGYCAEVLDYLTFDNLVTFVLL